MTTIPKLNLDELAASVVKCFPALNLLEQRLSLELYRLLAEGHRSPPANPVRFRSSTRLYWPRACGQKWPD
jgi:hypothetical protein